MSTKERANRSPPPRPVMPRLPATTSSLRSSPAPRLAAIISTARVSPSPGQAPRIASTPSVASPRIKGADEDATPVKSIAPNGNITPRSSVRKNKISSTNSSPTQSNVDLNGAFSPSTYKPSALGPGSVIHSPRSALVEKAEYEVNVRGTQFSGFSPINPTPRPHLSPAPIKDAAPLRHSELGPSFFRAGDGPPEEVPPRPALAKKGSSFVYADGRRETTVESSQVPPVRAPLSTVSAINGTRYTGPSPASPIMTGNGFSHLNRPTTSPSPSFVGPQGLVALASRSPSPNKFDFHLSYRKGASQIIRPPESGPIPLSTCDIDWRADTQRRRSSLDIVDELDDNMSNLGVSLSNHKDDTWTQQKAVDPARRMSQLKETLPTLTPSLSPSETSVNQAILASSTSGLSRNVRDRIDDSASPMPSTDSQDLASRARQERKVLDLEISNSSLLAINRSLEREMRKQQAEMRRLRRFTRNTARTSWMSDVTSISSIKRRIDEPGNEDDVDLEDEGSDIMSDLASTTLSDGTMSPATQAQNDASHLQEDRSRLRFDLSKHREVLADSQKMNVSLKRCLGMAEQLINDGRKALEYEVSVSDVKLGGRVLSPEELDNSSLFGRSAYDYFDNGPRLSDNTGNGDFLGSVGSDGYEASIQEDGVDVGSGSLSDEDEGMF